jgi:hypothetical protein
MMERIINLCKYVKKFNFNILKCPNSSPPLKKGDLGGFLKPFMKSPPTPLCERGA